MLRTIAFQNPSLDPPHPWYKDQSWIVSPWKCESAPIPGTISLIEVNAKDQTNWMIECTDGPQDLATIIKKYDLKKIMFRIRTPEPPAATSLSKYMEQITTPLEIGVWSTVAAVGRDLRKLRPDWLFAFDSAAALQFQTLSKLFIEPVASLWADFWIEDAQLSSAFLLKDRSRAEVIRRNKKIITIDDGSTTQWPQDAKGIMTTRPTYWLSRPR